MRFVLLLAAALGATPEKACAGPPAPPDKEPDMSMQQRYQELALGNEFARWGQSRGGWGVAKRLAPGSRDGTLAQGQKVGFTDVPSPTIGRVARVQNISLVANVSFPGVPDALGILRWELQAGVGTASTKIIVDARRFQQLSLSAEATNIKLFLDKNINGFSDPGTMVVDAASYVSDGNTSTSPSTYTLEFLSPNGGPATVVDIPEGATSWMIFGQAFGGGVNQATMTYRVLNLLNASEDAYTGDQLLAAHTTGAFIPLPGNGQKIQIENSGAGPVTGLIVFQLDL